MNNTKKSADIVAGDAVYHLDPVQTLNRFLKLHQCLLSSFSENIEKQHDINIHESRVMMMVGEMGRTASHEIVEATGMQIMAISRTVAALQKRGLLTTEIDANNRRRKLLQLTEAGKALYHEVLPTSTKVAEYIFESLRLDEMMSFDYYLQTLNSRVSAVDEKGESIFVQKTRA